MVAKLIVGECNAVKMLRQESYNSLGIIRAIHATLGKSTSPFS